MNLMLNSTLESNGTFEENVAEEEELLFDQIDDAEMQTRRTVKLVFCIGYALLFLLGTLGNGFVVIG